MNGMALKTKGKTLSVAVRVAYTSAAGLRLAVYTF